MTVAGGEVFYSTKELIERIDSKLDRLEDKMVRFIEALSSKADLHYVNAIETRLSATTERLTTLENKDTVKPGAFDRVDERLKSIDGRVRWLYAVAGTSIAGLVGTVVWIIGTRH